MCLPVCACAWCVYVYLCVCVCVSARLCVMSRIYKYQAHGYAFSSVEELLHSLGGSGFLNMTHRSLSESLLELGVSQRFIDEVIAPITRVNYRQNNSIPAFVGQGSHNMLNHVREMLCFIIMCIRVFRLCVLCPMNITCSSRHYRKKTLLCKSVSIHACFR